MKLTKKEEMEKKKELTLDMLQPSRYKPNDLEQMAEDTKFSKSKKTLPNMEEVQAHFDSLQGRYVRSTDPLSKSVPTESSMRKLSRRSMKKSFPWVMRPDTHTWSLVLLTGTLVFSS